MAPLLRSYSPGNAGRLSVNLMLPISNKLIPGEVQIIFGVMSLRRAGFSSQPPAPCIPSAAICHVPCLCLSPVQTDLGRGNRGGTGVTEKHQVSTMVKIYSPPHPKTAPPGKHGPWPSNKARPRASARGQGPSGCSRDGSGRCGHKHGWAVPPTAALPSHQHRSRPGMCPEPPGALRDLASGGEVARRGATVASLGGKAFVLLPPPCGHKFSFLPGLSIVSVAGL